MAESTWERDVQVMEAVRQLEREQPPGGTRDQVAELTGLDRADANDALLGLIEGDHVSGLDTGTLGEQFDWMSLRLTNRGRRVVGQWPSDDPADALVRLLEERLAQTENPEEASKLRRVLETVSEVGAGVLRDTLTALIRGAAGL